MAGSLIHLKGDSYRLLVSAGTDGNGRRIRHTKTIKASSAREADKQLAQFVADVERGVITNAAKITFKEFSEMYLRDEAEHRLAPKTLFRYRQLLNDRIIPVLGNIKLEKLTPNHLLKFYASLREPGARKDGIKNRGLSEQTILHHHRLIYTLLHTAVQWNYLSINPADRCRAPRVPRKEAASYDQEQLNLLLDKLKNVPSKYRLIVLLAIALGAREGEIFGLEWRHIDFDKGTIRIEQSSQYLPDIGTFIKPTKTHRTSTVSVPPIVIEALREFRDEQNAERIKHEGRWERSDRILLSSTGRPMYPGTMSSWFPKFLRKHNLPHLPYHGLRHTSASLLTANGASVVDVSKRLGHSTPTTTMNIYAHSFPKADLELAKMMANILNKADLLQESCHLYHPSI